ncbi:2Fe-2S iron-sulfur cluster-binding protein [Actinoplanes sp. NBRC 101535]|uniref:2Fe-2S iron-sulfur cluster-binding protein n=1 Tax=Actinoplanes sp. NBRC 101535 TaxID=3032196 RepID=UPI0024A16A89|nr:2Fe-2S iron-sulfur cluster-binding protein [Actinoplanes sp. NBRC 101535]GLY04059.1 hypothetical protein Acsp01_44380 [Actinoplanes sp. NBRC 101535]
MSWENTNTVQAVERLEATIGRPAAIVMRKQLDRLDDGCVQVLEFSPIAGLGYLDGDGNRRSTYVGGAAGFARVQSPERISFEVAGDGPVVGAGVSMLFLLPGVGETLRLNGVAAGFRDGRLTVDVRETYIHCARAVLRSRLWQPAVDREFRDVPELGGPLGDRLVREFLQVSPFLVLSTGDDTSPRGDQPGFVRVLDGHTLIIPDRRGNQRADTFHNLLDDDRIAFAALRPGSADVLHVHGTATITVDPELLDTMRLRDVAPQAALLFRVHDASLRKNAAVTGSRLWRAAQRADPSRTPNMVAIGARHATGGADRIAGIPAGVLLRPVTALSGVLRRVMDLSYRKALADEGYAASDKPVSGTRRMRVVRVRRETPDAVTVVLRDTASRRPIDFRPGQFFTLVTEVDGRPVRRAYSASSAPGSRNLEVTVKRVPGGLFSTHASQSIRPGDHFEVKGPSGTFHSGPDATDLVMIAAGSGVTPMMSMIRGGAPGRMALLYGNRDEGGTLFAAELARLTRKRRGRLSVTHRLTRPAPGWTGDRGRLDEPAITAWLDAIAPAESAQYLVCGPDGVLEAARAVLTARGVPAQRIHVESYASALDGDVPATGPHPMTVEQDGEPVTTVVVDPGTTLLDAGLAAGVTMPYSCTVGNCGECLVKLRSGTVVTSEPNCLTPRQREAGLVPSCVTRPTSPVTVDVTEW